MSILINVFWFIPYVPFGNLMIGKIYRITEQEESYRLTLNSTVFRGVVLVCRSPRGQGHIPAAQGEIKLERPAQRVCFPERLITHTSLESVYSCFHSQHKQLDIYRVDLVMKISGIKMLPSIGKPDIQIATPFMLPLLMEGLSNEERDENSSHLPTIEQGQEGCLHRCTTPGTPKTGD